jgi:hypothetical protein
VSRKLSGWVRWLPDEGLSVVSDRGWVESAVELSDVSLLVMALSEAEEARSAGWVVGPMVDELALRRAVRRARRVDARRVLRRILVGAGVDR